MAMSLTLSCIRKVCNQGQAPFDGQFIMEKTVIRSNFRARAWITCLFTLSSPLILTFCSVKMQILSSSVLQEHKVPENYVPLSAQAV